MFVAVTQNAKNTSMATLITLTNGGGTGPRASGAFDGFGRTSGSACDRRGQRFGAGGGTPETGNGNGRGIRGTVSQLNGNTLTVTDTNQSDDTITLSSATRMVQISQVSARSLQVGMRVTLVGVRNAQGELTAQAVTILPSEPGT